MPPISANFPMIRGNIAPPTMAEIISPDNSFVRSGILSTAIEKIKALTPERGRGKRQITSEEQLNEFPASVTTKLHEAALKLKP